VPHIRLSIDDAVASLFLDNPPQNRIGDETANQLSVAIDEISASEARVLLLRAEGADFSFGGDIMTWPDMEVRELRALFERYMSVFNRFERLPIPVIAVVQGLCFGGGFELALRADVIFAGSTARFGHPEQSLGIVTLLGGIYRVAERAGRAFASDWALTSQQVPATVMERHGVVNCVIDDHKLVAEATAYATKIAAGPTRAYAAHKALLRAWAVGGVAAADEAMFDIAIPLFETNDVKTGLASAVNALKAGLPRPVMDFIGR
jgi:enoyl-CoA hydratase/carnithine racemase